MGDAMGLMISDFRLMIEKKKNINNGGRDRSTARLTLGVGLAVSAFPLSVPV